MPLHCWRTGDVGSGSLKVLGLSCARQAPGLVQRGTRVLDRGTRVLDRGIRVLEGLPGTHRICHGSDRTSKSSLNFSDAVPAQMTGGVSPRQSRRRCRGEPSQSRRRCGRGGPSQSRRRCGRGEPIQSQCRCGPSEPSPGALVDAVSRVPMQMSLRRAQSRRRRGRGGPGQSAVPMRRSSRMWRPATNSTDLKSTLVKSIGAAARSPVANSAYSSCGRPCEYPEYPCEHSDYPM